MAVRRPISYFNDSLAVSDLSLVTHGAPESCFIRHLVSKDMGLR